MLIKNKFGVWKVLHFIFKDLIENMLMSNVLALHCIFFLVVFKSHQFMY